MQRMCVDCQAALIVIDPQIGFCSPSGSLALYYGAEEISVIRQVVPRIVQATEWFGRRHLVISEYRIGQFTDGAKDHPLKYLCVPEKNNDCAVDETFNGCEFSSLTAKHQQSALSSGYFNRIIDAELAAGIRRFVVCGFLLEHCVMATATDLSEKLATTEAKVSVAGDLAGSRLAKYHTGVVDAVYSALGQQGIRVNDWRETLSG